MPAYSIKELQQHILPILIDVDRVCREHNIRCYICDGTMLGAIRHGGFIPWDDDVDVCMPRPDYERFMQHAKEWLPGHLEAICAENDNDYPFPFGKIQDNTTTLIERMHIDYIGGLYIDVFPIDGMPDSKLLQEIQLTRYEYYKKVLYFLHRDPYKHGHWCDAKEYVWFANASTLRRERGDGSRTCSRLPHLHLWRLYGHTQTGTSAYPQFPVSRLSSSLQGLF